MRTLFIGFLLISTYSFADSLSDISKIAAESKLNTIAQIAAQSGFSIVSITSNRALTGAANKGACQIYNVKFRSNEAIVLQKGNSFEERQKSIEGLDKNIQVCATSVDDFFALQLMQYEYDGKVDTDTVSAAFEGLSKKIAKQKVK